MTIEYQARYCKAIGGPYWTQEGQGMAQPKHGTGPIVVEETAGKKAYCMCGHSESLPYCDGAHSRVGADVGPKVVDVGADGKKAICQCHVSGNLPWCDGAHSKL